MTPSHPSPTNLSDELRERLTETIRNMVTDCYMRDEDGNFTPVWWDEFPLVDEIVDAITAAYAEAIRGCVPEKQHDLLEDSMGNEYRPMVQEGYNQAIDTMLDNLKKKGLLPDDPINQEKP